MNLIKTTTAAKIVFAASVLGLSVSAQAFTIDFEANQGAGGPVDNGSISTAAVFTDGTLSVTMGFDTTGDGNADTDAAFEAVGAGDPNRGFANTVSGDDTAVPGASSSLGNFFLRTEMTGQDAADIPSLIIDYLTPVAATSAEIWDIDARNDGVSFEQYRVEAFGASGLLATVDSPQGQPAPPFGETNPLNGDAWTFGFGGLGEDITQVVISYIGTADNVGLAFDNFNVDANVIVGVPVPGALSMLALGLLLVAPRLRKS